MSSLSGHRRNLSNGQPACAAAEDLNNPSVVTLQHGLDSAVGLQVGRGSQLRVEQYVALGQRWRPTSTPDEDRNIMSAVGAQLTWQSTLMAWPGE